MPSVTPAHPEPRRTWSVAEVEALLSLPFSDLMYQAQQVHRAHFDPNRVQVSTLLSIKTGACPEDCGYCSQSAQHETGLARERLLPLAEVMAAATAARDQGATRFCMGAAWRNPTDRNLDQVVAMIEAVHDLGLETCVTLGMLTGPQAERLKAAGLDYYNHNLDTSPEFYGQVITTRTYQDRLDTLAEVQRVGLKVCSGGILGMGESRRDRAGLLCQLANLPQPPESVPINLLVQVEGTPLYGAAALDPFELVRTVAAARILMPDVPCPPVRRAQRDERRDSGPVLSGRCELHLLRRPAVDHPQRRDRPGPGPVRASRALARGGTPPAGGPWGLPQPGPGGSGWPPARMPPLGAVARLPTPCRTCRRARTPAPRSPLPAPPGPVRSPGAAPDGGRTPAARLLQQRLSWACQPPGRWSARCRPGRPSTVRVAGRRTSSAATAPPTRHWRRSLPTSPGGRAPCCSRRATWPTSASSRPWRGGVRQVFEDRRNHASLIDGALLSGARLRRYPTPMPPPCRACCRQRGGVRGWRRQEGLPPF